MNESKPNITEEMIASRISTVEPLEDEFKETISKDSNMVSVCPLDNSEIAFGSLTTVIVCNTNGQLKHRFSVNYHIKKVMYVSFPRTKDDQKDTSSLHCLAVVGEQNITFFTDLTNHPYTYFVPFKIRNIYQVKYGLLIEQNWANEEEFKAKQDDHIYLYSLTHPLNELLPVLYRPKEFLGQFLFCWEEESMSLIDSFDDLVIIFDRESRVHRLYYLRCTLAEELKASIYLMRNLNISTKRHSTPKGPTASTPKTTYEGGYQHHMQTRSMIRLTRTRTFPLDSPALSNIGTPPNINISVESTPFRLRSATQPSITSFGPNLTKILERDLNSDIFYADFCLECIWAEPTRKDMGNFTASKAFLSRSLSNQTYVNYFVPEAKQLRCFEISDDDHKTIFQTSFGMVSGLDATYLEKDKLSVVMESERYLVIYSGIMKICTIQYPLVGMDDGIHSIHKACGDAILLVSPYGNAAMLNVRPIYGNTLVEELFLMCISTLSSTEKSAQLINSWRLYNYHENIVIKQKRNTAPLVHAAFQFLLSEMGIIIGQHPILNITNDETSMNLPKAKQRRPHLAKNEMLSRLHAYASESTKSNMNEIKVTLDTSRPFFQYFQQILTAMHCTWQQWALDESFKMVREETVDYLIIAANIIKHELLLDLYNKEFPKNKPKPAFKITVLNNIDFNFPKTPYLDHAFTLYSMIGKMLKASIDGNRCTTQLFTHSSKISQFILAIAVGMKMISNHIDITRFLGKKWRRFMPLGTENSIFRIISSKKATAEEKCAELLKIFKFGKTNDMDRLPCVLTLLVGKIVTAHDNAAKIFQTPARKKSGKYPIHEDHIEFARLRWPNDRRMDNAHEMLRSDKQVLINNGSLQDGQTYSNDQRDIQEQFLLGACIRYLATAFGRSMKEFRLYDTLPVCRETGAVYPELCLQSRIFPTNVSYDIPSTEVTRPYKDWGEFYNGVAAALRVGHSDLVKLESEYILTICVKHDKVTMSNQTSAGLLYGFALNGHVLSSTYHVSELLIQMDEFQSVALLLGYGVAKLGTGDIKTYKMLGTQLPFLMGPTTLSITIPSINQTAALGALGFLFAETYNTTLVKKLLNEIGKSLPPEEAPANDRFAYRLNAGFAIGLIMLGQGNEILEREPPFEESQSSIVDRLEHLMKGHPRHLCVFPINSVIENQPNSLQQPPSCHVREREYVNTHLTGQAACVALGLMFLQTNNDEVAAKMTLPNAVKQLEGIKPDLIMTRILCKLLIMWDSMKPDREFIENLIPPVVEMRLKTKDILDDRVSENQKLFGENVDYESITQVYCYILCGAALALGLRYKNGYPNEKRIAYETVLFFSRKFMPPNQCKSMCDLLKHAGSNVSSLLNNCLITSLGMLMCSTGDLETMRLARLWRINDKIRQWMKCRRKHQEQIAAHQALGMLFLGNGRFGFKEDLLSNALLFISFFPIVSHGVNDSRFYHQPLRFLWTQAVEERLLVGIDFSKNKTKADIVITYKNNAIEKFETPYLIPSLEVLSRVEVKSTEACTYKYDMSIQSQKEELYHILTKEHGNIQIPNQKFSRTGFTDEHFYIENPEMDCQKPPMKYEENIALELEWPSLISKESSMRRHLNKLQKRLMESSRKRVILPEVRVAEILAKWANEETLAFAIELAIDRLICHPAKKAE